MRWGVRLRLYWYYASANECDTRGGRVRATRYPSAHPSALRVCPGRGEGAFVSADKESFPTRSDFGSPVTAELALLGLVLNSRPVACLCDGTLFGLGLKRSGGRLVKTPTTCVC